jgi:hypothetical protein
MARKVEEVIRDIYAKNPERWDDVKAKIEGALAVGEAKIKAAEQTMAVHADEFKAKNPEAFGKMEKAVTVCQDKLSAATKAFISASAIVKDKVGPMSAVVAAKVAKAYGECVHLLLVGKNAFDDAVKQAKASFPEMFTSGKNALTESSSSLGETAKAVEDAVTEAES